MTDKANQNEIPEEENLDQATDDTQSVAELEEQLNAALAKAQENWDKAVRATAELENVRRRAERDLENAHKYALEKFMHELLPIKDSLELGIQAAAADDADIAKLREGSELTLKLLTTALEKFGIEVIDPLGDSFDPEHHQAMAMLDSPDHGPNTVVAVMQKGYKLNDRLVRPAMVAVSKTKENSANNVDEKA